MKKPYTPAVIEKKWQKEWEKKKVYQAKDPGKTKKKKYYALVEFPYPSGEGLHVGHPRPYIGLDIVSRKRRAEGYNVLYPMGWDAFGLPAENYAIKTGIAPAIITKKNAATFRRQIQLLGTSFDWSREINTTDPGYYKWTQWLFLKFLEHGLAYKAKMNINWCPKDKIGLANEEVINGKCERCGTEVEKREKEQWMLAITKYADRLDRDLDTVNYQEKIKLQQRNWIGRSEGAEIPFALSGGKGKINVFTTRPDTIFGATYVVLAPEHPLVQDFLRQDIVTNTAEVEAYIAAATKKEEIERTAEGKEKTGVELKGLRAVNPATGEEIPVWIADYVLAQYGTGAVMAVPAHDERDHAFAAAYGLPIREVILPNIIDRRNPPVAGKKSVERRNVHPIVRDTKTGKYLALKWKKFDWTTFPMGGIEDGEDVVEAAKREVREETGFTNLKLVKVLSGQVRAEYFAAHKDQNRIAFTTGVLFELVDHTQVAIAPEESEAHDIIWLDQSQFNYDVMTHAETDQWLEKMKPGYAAYIGSGVLINSGAWSGKESEHVKKEMVKAVGGRWVTKFKLRDWVFSRQRYWGEPIPVIHCPACGIVPVPYKDLPVMLPKVKKYQPTETGESPLASISSWVNVKCPRCGGKGKRETDTMPNWAGSSWYFFRYTDPKNKKIFADPKKLKYWMPVDWYNGGMEHTTLHLLYSRFWNKFLYDIKLVPTSEPYKKRTSHGFILAGNGEKMSKSRGNVINPDSVVAMYGADTLRLYEMFMGPFDQAIPWDERNIVGVRRFVEKVWRLTERVSARVKKHPMLEPLLHRTVKKVSEDIENISFNTAVSALMILTNEMEKADAIPQAYFETFLILLAAFAPHVAEELWHALGHKSLIVTELWPRADARKMKESQVTIVLQVNGKVRGEIILPPDQSEKEVTDMARRHESIQKWIEGKDIRKVIYVPNKLVNIVV